MSKPCLHVGLTLGAVALLLAAGGALVCSASAAEPAAQRPLIPDEPVRSVVQGTETKKAEPRKIERLAPDSPLNGVADLPWFLPPPSQPQRRGPLTREQKEELDRRKNWIFVDPKSAGADAEKMLGVREEQKFEREEEYKPLMQQHLEKGTTKVVTDSKDSGKEAKAKDSAETKAEARTATGDSFFILPGDAARYGNKSDALDVRAFGTRPASTGSSSLLTPAPSPTPDSTPGGFFSTGGGRSGTLLPEAPLTPSRTDSQKEWAAEFKQLLEGKTPSNPGFGRSGDPANWFSDPSRQSLNPVIGVRPDTYSRPSVPAPGASFGLPSRPSALDSFNRTPSLTDNGSSLFGAPGLSSPGLNSSPLNPPLSAPRPGSFQDLPKRKF
jgi:hypothetical protein